MKPRLLVNLGLLALIAVLATIAILKPGKNEVESTPLLALDLQGLNRVTLKNKETLVFEKKEGLWNLTAPFVAPVNQVRVGQLLDITKAVSEANYSVQPDDLAQFGLDTPQAVLGLDDMTLQFGSTDPIKMRRYVRIGETLHLVEDNFFHHLTASASDYVDKRLIPERAKIREIQLPDLKATRDQQGQWTVEPNAKTGTDLAELTSVWATARAIEVKRWNPVAEGEPIRIGFTEGPTLEFVIINKSPELVLGRKDLGLQYTLTAETSRELLNLPKPKSEAEPESDSDHDENFIDGDGEPGEDGDESHDGDDG